MSIATKHSIYFAKCIGDHVENCKLLINSWGSWSTCSGSQEHIPLCLNRHPLRLTDSVAKQLK